VNTLFNDDSYFDPGLAELRERLGAADSEVRRIALLDLSDFAGDEHAPLFIEALRDPVGVVRAEAARALEAFESPDSVAGLVALLSDDDETVCKAAADSLGALKQPESARLLLPHAAHPHAFVRATILRALRELRAAGSFAPALAALGDTDASVRREAVAVLGYLKRAEALPALNTLATSDADPEVRRAAVAALGFETGNGETGSTTLAALLAGLNDSAWQVREEAATTLGKLGLAQAGRQLVAALQDAYWQVRLRAARSLGRLRDAAAVPALADALAHPIGNLRKEAALALGEIRDVSALPALNIAQDDADPEVRKAVRLAIVQIRSA
jgi:HEAT repeat protein